MWLGRIPWGQKKLASISDFQDYPDIPRTFIEAGVAQTSKKKSNSFPTSALLKSFNPCYVKMSPFKSQSLQTLKRKNLFFKIFSLSKSLGNLKRFSSGKSHKARSKGQNGFAPFILFGIF